MAHKMLKAFFTMAGEKLLSILYNVCFYLHTNGYEVPLHLKIRVPWETNFMILHRASLIKMAMTTDITAISYKNEDILADIVKFP